MLDSGDGVSHAVPVYEGFAIPSSMRRIDVAGRDVTEYMQTLLRKSGYVFHTSAEKEVVRLIKESVSYVAINPKAEEKEWRAMVAERAYQADEVSEEVVSESEEMMEKLDRKGNEEEGKKETS